MAKHCTFLSRFPLLGIAALSAGMSPAWAGNQRAVCSLAVTDVHVVSMANVQIRRNQTVRIEGGRILSISRAKGDRGTGCGKIVNARGKYLVPGLNDVHVHVETNAFTKAFGIPAASFDFEAVLAPYLAHGVTGVRVLSGAPDILAFRQARPGAPVPRLVVSSPMLSGDPPIMPEPLTRVVKDAPSARAAVAEFLDHGYDFIKIRGNLSKEVYAAVLDETHKRGSYVDGHVTRAVGAEAALRSGQDAFAHLDELAMAISKPGDLERMTRLVRTCKCFVSSALSVTRSIADQLTDYDAVVARPEMRYLHPVIVGAFWLKPNNPYFTQEAQAEFFEGVHKKSKEFLMALVDTGATVVAGTDAMNPMIIPGVSLHDELRLMVEAGLTPHQALRTATVDVARHVPGFEGLGTLEKGRSATALLVSANPLADLDSLRRPEAVLLKGKWLDRAALDALLAKAAAQSQPK